LFVSVLYPNYTRRIVQMELEDCHALHRRLMRAFPEMPNIEESRRHFGVLYRLETDDTLHRPRIIVQSRTLPDWSANGIPFDYFDNIEESSCASIASRYDAITTDEVMPFILRGNPTKRLSSKNGINGKRVAIRDEAGWHDWLKRKSEQSGFEVLNLSKCGQPEHKIGRQLVTASRLSGYGDRRMTFTSIDFAGTLRVTNADDFKLALCDGIGTGKAFGYGLLMV